MHYRLRPPHSVVELIRGLHPELKRKVRAGLEVVLEQPTIGKSLKDELTGLRSLRLGRLRLVYRTGEGGVVEVVALGPRRSIYEETLRLVRRDER